MTVIRMGGSLGSRAGPWSARYGRCKPGALLDRALGVELDGDLRATDQVGARAGGDQLVVRATDGLLPGAEHHVVRLDENRLAVDEEVQTVVVDPDVRRAPHLADPGLPEHR